MKIWRQGDVVFQQIEGIVPASQELKAQTEKVEFHSETGRIHSLQLLEGSLAYQSEDQQQLSLIHLSQPTQVLHDEHRPLTLPAGNFRAFRIRDWQGQRGD